MDNYTRLINYLGKQMSQGNTSVSERLLQREEMQPEKLRGSAGIGGGTEEPESTKVRGAR